MIRDILGACMDEDFWELDAPVSKKKNSMTRDDSPGSKTKDDSPGSKKKKNKAKVIEESEDDDEDEDDSPVEKKKKIKKSKNIKAKVVVEESEDEDDSPAEKKEKKKEKEKVKHGKRKMRSDTSGDEDSEEECDLGIQIKNIPKLKKKKETEGGDIAEVLKVLQGMASTIANFDTRLTSLEGKGNVLKAVVDEQSNTGVGGDASVEEDDLSKRLTFKEKETESTAVKRKKGAECVEIHNLKERSDSDFVTPPSRRKMMHYAYSSSDDNDDIKAKQINDALDNALGAIAKLSDNDDLEVPPVGRNKNLAPSQKSPFIGHSRTVRIMAGTVASSVVYNPFEPVDQHKEEKLLDYVNQDL
ncbi:hypothetical protein AALP_AAs69197U000100 [Arabis alpina]|uniref:Uncharacterized protein n=1 Tax=Arabis alpina TaxID=50452 RepID=A0A087FY28_ARAAL|nr:hypothetical protein AALP_AAs69197U000100 [Arabis alpina]